MLKIQLQNRLGNFELEIRLDIPLGTTTAVIGANGSGKTSLLRCLAGLAHPDGRIHFGEKPWVDNDLFVPPYAREIGYVFQDARLFSHLTVSENLTFAERHSTGRPVIISRDTVLDNLALEKILHRHPLDLSGGEVQRVAIARALLCQPRLLLLDEPLGAIDDETRKRLLSFFQELSTKHTLTTVFVSHAIDEITTLADQALLLDRGRTVAFGSTGEVLRARALQTLTGYRNSGAVLSARFDRWDKQYSMSYFSVNGQSLAIPLFYQSSEDAHALIFVQARDVSIALHPCHDISIRNELPGTVQAIEQSQDPAFVDVKIAIGEQHIFSRITCAASDALKLKSGVHVYALIKSASFN